MGKALKIVFYVLVIALLFLWAMTVAEKCKNKKLNSDQTEQTTDDLLDEEFSDDIGDLTELSDDDIDDLSDNAEDSVDGTNNDDSADTEVSFEDLSETDTKVETSSDDTFEEDLTDLSSPVEETTKSEPARTAPTQRLASSISSGDYLLVAGNYSVHSNAEKMMSKLKRMGFNSAEIVQFDNSNFSTVVASRFNDYDKATAAKANLVSRGIDCYVHKQKF